MHGLADVHKRRKVISKLLFHPVVEERPHIFSFQVTFLRPEMHSSIAKDLYSDVYFSSSCEYLSKGVLIGFRPNLNYKVVHSVSSPEGLYLVLSCIINDKPITLVSVYCSPNLQVHIFAEFLNEIQEIVDSFGNPDTLWFGDFNSMLDRNLDMHDPNRRPHKYSKTTAEFIEAQELTDVWRCLHPQEKRFTCFSSNHCACSCIDLLLASPTFMTRVVKSEIHAAYCSDHSPVSITFTLSDNERGKGFFRIPNFLLKDASYQRIVCNTVHGVQGRNRGCDPAVLWDLVKAQVRGSTIQYLNECKKFTKLRIEDVEQEIFEATVQRDLAPTDDFRYHYTSKVKFLQIELDDIFHSINIRDKEFKTARKYYDFERSNKYYFRTLGYHNQAIKSLKNENMELCSSDQDILRICHRFYTRLYCQEIPVSSPNLRWEYLQNIPCNRITGLNEQTLSSELTLDDLYTSLKNMSVNKSPGEDGLTVEFYRTFWCEIRFLVFESIKHSYEIGRMSLSQ